MQVGLQANSPPLLDRRSPPMMPVGQRRCSRAPSETIRGHPVDHWAQYQVIPGKAVTVYASRASPPGRRVSSRVLPGFPFCTPRLLIEGGLSFIQFQVVPFQLGHLSSRSGQIGLSTPCLAPLPTSVLSHGSTILLPAEALTLASRWRSLRRLFLFPRGFPVLPTHQDSILALCSPIVWGAK